MPKKKLYLLLGLMLTAVCLASFTSAERAGVPAAAPAVRTAAASGSETGGITAENVKDAEDDMNMVGFVSAIEHKKLGMELTDDEIAAFANGAAKRTIPDYQLAAMLMAIRLNGMTEYETAKLTEAMRDSGDVVDLSGIKGITVDKHSTGGVSDDTTFLVAPLVAACGAPVVMMSGRGLGHTGGTLDKLESINGFRVDLTSDEVVRQVNDIGIAIFGQTGDIAPADKKLYALRDVTSTVDSIPLIASSIMSKKLASGTASLVLDVKTGSGAVMEDPADSEALARAMVDICRHAGVKVTALITDMNQPLGTYIGNALEIKQIIDILKGESDGGDLLDLSLTLGSYMLVNGGITDDPDDAREMLTKALRNGSGLKKFKEMIAAQGGDPAVCDDTSLLPQAPYTMDLHSYVSGYVKSIDTKEIGLAAQALGAGRLEMEDEIDHSVGMYLPVRIGDHINEGDYLGTIYAKNAEDALKAAKSIARAVSISFLPEPKPVLVYKVIEE